MPSKPKRVFEWVPHDQRSLIAFIVGLLWLSLTPAAPAQALLTLVDSHYNHLASLRTHFTERYTGLGLDRTECGTLLLRKPGRMRWTYSAKPDAPATKLFVFDGHYAWSYTTGDAQVSRIPARQLDDLHTPLRFLLGHTQLKKELDAIAITPAGANFRITGVPHGMAARIKSLSLTVTPTGLITSMTLEELDGATTAFTFTDITENVPTRDTDFLFTPPPGVAIIDGTPPL
jgi:outer membrane lipoprotein carrier protein